MNNRRGRRGSIEEDIHGGRNWNVKQTIRGFLLFKRAFECALLRLLSRSVVRYVGWREREEGRRVVNGKRGGSKEGKGRKERRHKQVFTSRLASAKGCRPCLCVLLTRWTSILSACLRKLISIAAETAPRNESIDTTAPIFSTPPPKGGGGRETAGWSTNTERTILRIGNCLKSTGHTR